MPGIIPMKLIRCGSSQTRIAQACDRCRSKKIRCDGVRPCCSQCSNVGFECKTSDKLSRRAFPRGYTESLEERVRSLEQEVRELKDLLDAKDEQLDMLSRIHSFSPYSPPASASGGGNKAHKTLERARSGSVDMAQAVDETFVVQEANELVKDGAEAVVYMGASSGRTFVELLKKKMHESGRPTQHVKIDAEAFFNTREIVNPAADQQQTPSIKAPPRLLSDHLLVSYFQEYHPLFPVLYRPTFLALYEKLVSGDGSAASSLPNHAIAQLFLVFAIALQQNEPQNGLDQQQFDYQWQRALDRIVMESNLDTLQCLVLAQLYCFSRGDYTRLLQYKSLAVGTALRLGLNQNQRKFSLGALSGEMRKRAFWCVYCLDNFSAAMLGLPKLFKEDSIEAEYPSDIDDEYVSEKGFLPTLPGDSTKISSALALFRSSRVLAKVLETVYPTSSSHELSCGKLKELEDELDSWKNGLAPHLRLEFVNGTPATNIVHSRSPLLVLSYHYIRVLIHRPVLDSSLAHNKVSASLIAIRESSKCIIQIIQLLTERKLGFSFCLNRVQLLLLSGFTILYSSLDGALVKDSQKLVSGVLEELERDSGTIAKEFRSIASLVVSCEMRSTAAAGQVLHEGVRSNSLSPLSDHHLVKKSPIRRRMSSISEKMNFRRDKDAVTTRRACSQDLTMDTGFHSNYGNRTRLTSASLTDLSPPPLRGRYASPVPLKVSRPSTSYESQNFDFLWHLDASNTITDTTRSAISTDEWERMLAVMDASHAVHIYGDGSNTLLPPAAAAAATSATRAPTTTDHGATSRQVDAHWSLGGTNQPSSSFHRTPPSVSTLSDEGRTADLPGGGGGEFLESEGLGDFLVPMMAAGGAAGGSLMDNGGDWGL